MTEEPLDSVDLELPPLHFTATDIVGSLDRFAGLHQEMANILARAAYEVRSLLGGVIDEPTDG